MTRARRGKVSYSMRGRTEVDFEGAPDGHEGEEVELHDGDPADYLPVLGRPCIERKTFSSGQAGAGRRLVKVQRSIRGHCTKWRIRHLPEERREKQGRAPVGEE